MKYVRMTCIAGALASAPAAAQPDKQAHAEVTPGEARSWITLFEKVVDTVVAHREDCGKMASAVHGVVDANQETIAMARDARAKGKRLPASVQQQMVDASRRMIGALDKCGRDERVAFAFKRLDLGGRK
jgi:hypothetical protein